MVSDVAGEGAAGSEVDPRRALWRRGSYEIVGDWLASASLTVLDAAVAARNDDADFAGARLLDVATGTGTVAIDAARRGAEVTAIDLTDELLEIARTRATAAGVDVRFAIGDFDRLDECLGQLLDVRSAEARFDVVTSSFGVMFSSDPVSTLAGLGARVSNDGLVAVTSWHPRSAFMVPDSMLALMSERPPMPDMALWTTRIGELASAAALDLVSSERGELLVPFASVAEAAEELERWAGGWTQLLEMFDANGDGAIARHLLVDHLASFADPSDVGVTLRADYQTTVLRRSRVSAASL